MVGITDSETVGFNAGITTIEKGLSNSNNKNKIDQEKT